MSEPRPGFRITTITAFTVIGSDDEEGVMAFLDPTAFAGGVGVWMPMVAADAHRVDDLRRIAETMFANVEWRERVFTAVEP